MTTKKIIKFIIVFLAMIAVLPSRLFFGGNFAEYTMLDILKQINDTIHFTDKENYK